MDARFTEDQEMIRGTAEAFLTDWKDAGGFRVLSDASQKIDSKAWDTLAIELGFAGLTVPVDLGGAGLGAIERALVMEQMGRVLFMSPFFSTCVLALDVLQAAGGETAKAYQKRIAEGEITATVAELYAPLQMDIALGGQARGVIDGDTADVVFVQTKDSIFALEGNDEGVARHLVETLDRTRAIADLDIAFANAEPIASGPGLSEALQSAHARSAIALAAEQVGGADAMLNATVGYALERKQFGRTIGSFQAVKHRCADMMTSIETARSAVYLAAAMADRDDVLEYAAIAKSEASDTYFGVAGDAIQMHGGVGVTWEYDMHFHFKRARAGRSMLGSPQAWRKSLAKQIGLNGVAA